MDQADIVEDDEDDQSTEGARGGSSRKEKLVNTLTRLRPLLANYNSHETKPVTKNAVYNSPEKIKTKTLAQLLTPARYGYKTTTTKLNDGTNWMNAIQEETESFPTSNIAENY